MAMVRKKRVEGRNVGSVSIKTKINQKLTRALVQNPELFLGSEKLTRALGQNPELFLGSEFFEPRLFAMFSVPLNLRCYVTLGSEGTSVASSCIDSDLIRLMPISSVLRLPTIFLMKILLTRKLTYPPIVNTEKHATCSAALQGPTPLVIIIFST